MKRVKIKKIKTTRDLLETTIALFKSEELEEHEEPKSMSYDKIAPKVTKWERFYHGEKKVFSFRQLNLKNNTFAQLHNYIVSHKDVAFPIYKINNFYNLLEHNDYLYYSKSCVNVKTGNYTYDRRYIYELFSDITRFGRVRKFSDMQIDADMYLYLLQTRFKNDVDTKKIPYKIISEIDLEKYVTNNNGWTYGVKDHYLKRTKPIKIYLLDDVGKIKYKDVMVDMYNEYLTDVCRVDLTDKSYFGVFITEIIAKDSYNYKLFENLQPVFYEKHKNTPIYEIETYMKNNKLTWDEIEPRVVQRYADIAHYKSHCWIYQIKAHQCCFHENPKTYKVTDKIINAFNQEKLTLAEIDKLFNPTIIVKPTEVKNIITNDSDNENSDSGSDDEEIVGNPEVRVVGGTLLKSECIPKLIFQYNKNIKFLDSDKKCIEDLIDDIILTNTKAEEMFSQYTHIHILKNVDKQYTNKKYFNMVLFSETTKIYSPQFHCYICNNNISSITHIQNVIG